MLKRVTILSCAAARTANISRVACLSARAAPVRSFHNTDANMDDKKTRVEPAKTGRSAPPPPATPARGGDIYSDFKGEFPRIMGKHARIVKSLFTQAAATKNVENVERDMQLILNLVKIKIGYFKTLYKPQLSVEANVKTIREQFAGRLGFTKETTEVLVSLTEERDLDLMPRIARGFLETARHVRGEMSAMVISAETLSEQQKKQTQSVFDAIAAMRHKKSVTLSFHVDPALVGGFRFFIDDKEYVDFSLKRDIDLYNDSSFENM